MIEKKNTTDAPIHCVFGVECADRQPGVGL